jgi:hypothetical protein
MCPRKEIRGSEVRAEAIAEVVQNRSAPRFHDFPVHCAGVGPFNECWQLYRLEAVEILNVKGDHKLGGFNHVSRLSDEWTVPYSRILMCCT